MNFLLYLSTKINTNFYPQYPHIDDKAEVELINSMYETEVQEIDGVVGEQPFFSTYCDFLNHNVEVSQERKRRAEELTEEEFERLKKRLTENCPKKEACHRCSIEKDDCWLLHGWKKEGDEFRRSYSLLGEYLPDFRKVVLYVNNIDDACGKPTYNGVLSTYIHELFHAYFHYVTEQKQAERNYIREIEEAMTEFSTLAFLKVMGKMYGDEWLEILEWAKESIGKKQETVGYLPAYGFGLYLFDNIPENEAFDWINKYAERLGYIDKADELVKQYKQMVCPCYPTEPNKCLELLRKILYETDNKSIKPYDNGFDEKTQEQLGFYVYLLVDPNDEKPFYVGKGQNNRVFDHIQYAKENPQDNSDKCDRIREIEPEKVKHYIVAHGLSADEAFLIESALIDVLNQFDVALTNIQEGHKASERGLMTTDEIKRLYGAGNLGFLDPNCVIININKRYNRAMGYDSIFEATHETWRMAKNKTKEIKFVLSEYRGLIIEVFEVDEWYQKERPTVKGDSMYLGWGFKGHRAPEKIRKMYINKSIAHKKKKGMNNPIRYSL